MAFEVGVVEVIELGGIARVSSTRVTSKITED